MQLKSLAIKLKNCVRTSMAPKGIPGRVHLWSLSVEISHQTVSIWQDLNVDGFKQYTIWIFVKIYLSKSVMMYGEYAMFKQDVVACIDNYFTDFISTWSVTVMCCWYSFYN